MACRALSGGLPSHCLEAGIPGHAHCLKHKLVRAGRALENASMYLHNFLEVDFPFASFQKVSQRWPGGLCWALSALSLCLLGIIRAM